MDNLRGVFEEESLPAEQLGRKLWTYLEGAEKEEKVKGGRRLCEKAQFCPMLFVSYIYIFFFLWF